ncbi:MAG: M16 family metallopeptidase [bacterium]
MKSFKGVAHKKGMTGRCICLTHLLVLLFIAGMFLSGCMPVQTARFSQHPSKISFPPIDFTPPKPERLVLPNGMVLYLMEDHEVPLITIHALVRTGGVYEPPDKVGLADITGEVMRTGGTRRMGPEEIDRRLEFLGAGLETGINMESGSAALSVMKKDFEEALGIFSDVLRYPSFAPEKIELAKIKRIESIRRQNDEPLQIASREFKRKVYNGDPRGRVRTIEGIQRIQREDLIEFHRSSFFPNNMIMGISGDFERSEMMERIKNAFGDWTELSRSIPPAPVPERPIERAVVYGERLLPQSTIILGHLCCPKNHPDYFPMEVLNNVLGDGFNSRLMEEIRSNRGLAYSVGSFYRGDIDYGVFGAYAMTKSQTTGNVIELIIHEINRVVENGLEAEELSWAKDSIINKYVFSFSSTAGLVKQYISLEYDHLPEDYIESYPGMISAITLEDIKRVAKKYLKPDKSVLVVVGNERAFDIPLNHFGQVEQADLSIR